MYIMLSRSFGGIPCPPAVPGAGLVRAGPGAGGAAWGSGSMTRCAMVDHHAGILEAHRRYLRLVRGFGRDGSIPSRSCRQWRDQREPDEGFTRRLAVCRLLRGGWRLSPLGAGPSQPRPARRSDDQDLAARLLVPILTLLELIRSEVAAQHASGPAGQAQ